MSRSVRILPVISSTMQSAPPLEHKWYIEYELTSARRAEALIGWVSSEDTMNQVRLEFDNLDAARAFAEEKGWHYTVVQPQKKKMRAFNYGDNFKYRPPQSESSE